MRESRFAEPETYVVLRKPRRDTYRGGLLGKGETESRFTGEAASRFTQEKLQPRQAAARRKDEAVEVLAPSMQIRLIEPEEKGTTEIPTDEPITWGVEAVGAPGSDHTGQGVTVAVLDSGIDPEHPAFRGVELIQRDFTGEGNGDEHGHGTHCAATIFGRDVDGIRIGVAHGIRRALIGKVTNSVGIGSTEQVIAAIQWAADEGAHIISMSLSLDFPGFAEHLHRFRNFPRKLAISKALVHYRDNLLLFDRLADLVGRLGKKPLLVAAAGNESRRHERTDFEISAAPPAATDGIVAVGALEKNDDRSLSVATFSNTDVDISGPGVGVISAKTGGGLEIKSGTSQAGPHVAGVAALWAEKLMERGPLDSRRLGARLISAATDRGLKSGFDPLAVGEGIAQAPRS